MVTYNYKKILKISLPLILGLLIQVLVGVTDTAFLGRVGEIELGASAIAGACYLFIFMLAQSFAAGAQIIMARRNGEKRHRKIGPIFYQSLSFVCLLALISIVLVYLSAADVMTSLVASVEVGHAILIYLIWRCWGLFFAGIIAVFRAFFVAVTNTRQLMTAAFILLVANIIFDYWLIFGGLGVAPMGVKGAAVASVIAEMCSALYLLFYTVFKVNLRRFGFNRFILWQTSLFKEIFHVSIWIAFLNFVSWGSWLYFFVEIEKLGVTALAISNILKSVSSLPFIFAGALATVASSVVSNLIGAEKTDEVMPTLKRILIFGSWPYYGLMLLMVLMPKLFLKIYTNDQQIIMEAIPAFYTMLLCFVLMLPAMIYFYAIYGTGKTQVALWFEIICSIFYVIEIRFVIGIWQMPLVWCWLSDLAYYLPLLALSYFYMRRNKWCCEVV